MQEIRIPENNGGVTMQLYRWRARSMAGKLYQGSYLADSKHGSSSIFTRKL